ncbi:DASS family sodium-coupled anion symporter [bacterium]|nr:DASS family sodium-coupled anion symporter [bacterium]
MNRKHLLQNAALAAGPALFFFLYFGSVHSIPLAESRAVLAITLWMSVWWIFEAIPLAATSLLPLILMPLTGVLPLGQVSASYGNPFIYLFLSGFLLALAIEKSRLHWRIALNLILWMGKTPKRMLWGFMLATGLISMWISNTATAIMMLPMAMAVAKKVEDWEGFGADFKAQFARSLLLGIAYASSIGGMATLIGSPPNLIYAGMVEKTFGETVTFARWMQAGLPVALLLLAAAGAYLGRGLNRTSGRLDRAQLLAQKQALGPMTGAEKKVLVVFLATALAWMLRSWLITPYFPKVDDTIIGLLGALALFAWPTREDPKLLDWKDAEGLPWGILLLFGGGIALASGFEQTGTAQWLAAGLASGAQDHSILPFALIVGSINFLTEITSNLATTAVALPVLAPFAESLGVHPYLLMVGATLAASCAFMLPVGTPPNAIVFASGKIRIGDMVRIGIAMNFISIAVITAYTYFVLPWLWGL